MPRNSRTSAAVSNRSVLSCALGTKRTRTTPAVQQHLRYPSSHYQRACSAARACALSHVQQCTSWLSPNARLCIQEISRASELVGHLTTRYDFVEGQHTKCRSALSTS